MRSINIKATLARLGYSSGGQNENSGLLKQRRHCSARSVRAKVMIRIAFCFYSGSRSKSPQLLVAAIYIGNRVASMMNEIQQYGYEVPGTNTKHTIGNSKNITKREQHLLTSNPQPAGSPISSSWPTISPDLPSARSPRMASRLLSLGKLHLHLPVVSGAGGIKGRLRSTTRRACADGFSPWPKSKLGSEGARLRSRRGRRVASPVQQTTCGCQQAEIVVGVDKQVRRRSSLYVLPARM